MIYAVQILDERYVKIGFSSSNDVRERISALQTGSPFEIVPMFTVDGTLMQEQALHSALRCAFGRIRIPMPPNEWYPGKNGFFRQFLRELKFGANNGLAFLDRYNPAVKQPGAKSEIVDPNYCWGRLPNAAGRKVG